MAWPASPAHRSRGFIEALAWKPNCFAPCFRGFQLQFRLCLAVDPVDMQLTSDLILDCLVPVDLSSHHQTMTDLGYHHPHCRLTSQLSLAPVSLLWTQQITSILAASSSAPWVCSSLPRDCGTGSWVAPALGLCYLTHLPTPYLYPGSQNMLIKWQPGLFCAELYLQTVPPSWFSGTADTFHPTSTAVHDTLKKKPNKKQSVKSSNYMLITIKE